MVLTAERSSRKRRHRTGPDARGGRQPSGVDPRAGTVGNPRYRSWGRRYARVLMVADCVALILAAVAVHLVGFPTLAPTAIYVPLLALTIALVGCWMLALRWFDSRDSKTIGYGSVEYKRVVHATLAVFGFMAIGSYLLALELPRSYLLVMLPVGLTVLLFFRHSCRRWLRDKRRNGHYLSKVLAIGDVGTVKELLRDLGRTPQAGYRVIGVCIDRPAIGGGGDDNPGIEEIDGVPVLGGLADIAGITRSCGADTVAVTSTASFGPTRVRSLSWELEDTDAELILAPALANIASPRIQTQPVAGLPLIHVDRPSYHGANRVLKKSFDIVGGLLLMLIFSPVLVVAAIAVAATSKGPVFFRQERVGLGGDIFRMIKFRSMVVDAEARLPDVQGQHRGAGNTVLFKMKNDPRVTPVGRFLRRFSIDELPQLFNVFTGEMSLVGPRPPLHAEVELYSDEVRRRLLVKPGMTGMWQVSGRSDLTWDETVNLDIYYVENWSITGDLMIIFKTAKAVLSSSGAY